MDKLRRALNGNERCDEESGIITQVITFNGHARCKLEEVYDYISAKSPFIHKLKLRI